MAKFIKAPHLIRKEEGAIEHKHYNRAAAQKVEKNSLTASLKTAEQQHQKNSTAPKQNEKNATNLTN